ncbi:MAG: peptidase domain-containing ABC transporter [Bacilli bacterium]|nr:peptidase domain-containing ABC transporter [Bacilli bacterium]
MFKKYTHIKQNGLKDCGIASLLTIIVSHGGFVPIEKLRDLTYTTNNGTTAYNLIEAARMLGFSAKGVKGTIDDLKKHRLYLPCIAHVILDKSYNHFIVIHKIDIKREILIISNPSKGIEKYTFTEFASIWSGVLIILYPVKKIPRIKPTKSLFSFFYDILSEYKKEIIMIFILSISVTIFSIINSFYVKILVDNLIKVTSYNNLYLISILFLFSFLFKTINDLIRKKLLILVNQKIDYSLYINVFKHIITLPYSYYKNRTTGEIISRINDLSQIKEMISKLFLTLFIDIILVLFGGLFLYLINQTLFLLAIIIGILYLLITFIFYPLFDKYLHISKKLETNISSYLVESINNFETIKGINMETTICDNFELKYNDYINNTYKFSNLYNIQYFFKDLLNEISTIIILLMGSILVIKGELSLGSLLAFNSLLLYFLNPIKNIIDFEPTIKHASISIKRMLELFDIESEKLCIDHKYLDNKISGNINFNNLSFSYNGRDKILSNISLEIKNGGKILIVGPSGNGKSTLLKLLMKYYSTSNNHIFIEGIDINNYNLKYLRENICYVSQNEMLFNDSIYNNITFGKGDYNKFINILKLVEGEKIYKNDPLGVDMLIEENGFNISGGEKQRIIIARTLFKDRSIYLFDESFNELDVSLERRLLVNIFTYLNNKTVILVSHRLNNSDLFDKVIHIENGQVVKIENGVI